MKKNGTSSVDSSTKVADKSGGRLWGRLRGKQAGDQLSGAPYIDNNSAADIQGSHGASRGDKRLRWIGRKNGPTSAKEGTHNEDPKNTQTFSLFRKGRSASENLLPDQCGAQQDQQQHGKTTRGKAAPKLDFQLEMKKKPVHSSLIRAKNRPKRRITSHNMSTNQPTSGLYFGFVPYIFVC
jgi:hypothetical protein